MLLALVCGLALGAAHGESTSDRFTLMDESIEATAGSPFHISVLGPVQVWEACLVDCVDSKPASPAHTAARLASHS